MEAHPNTAAVAADIAQQLNENGAEAIAQIERIVQHLGAEFAYNYLQKALDIEAKGGLVTHDKQKRRSPGGVYFFLVRGRVSPEKHDVIWPGHPYPWPIKMRVGPPLPPFVWDERVEILADALAHKQGEATSVKIKVVGRPGKIIERDQVVITPMASTTPPNLPKGLPVPPSDSTVYLVYIAQKQWRKVERSIQNPQDKLIVEGFPFHDKKLGVIAVFAQSATTVFIEKAKQQQQKEAASGNNEEN